MKHIWLIMSLMAGVGCGTHNSGPAVGVTCYVRGACFATKTPDDLALALRLVRRGTKGDREIFDTMHKQGRVWVLLSRSRVRIDDVGVYDGEHVAQVTIIPASDGRGPLPTNHCPGWVYASWLKLYPAIDGPRIRPIARVKYNVTIGRMYVTRRECLAGSTLPDLALARELERQGATGLVDHHDQIWRLPAYSNVEVIDVQADGVHIRFADGATGWINLSELW